MSAKYVKLGTAAGVGVFRGVNSGCIYIGSGPVDDKRNKALVLLFSENPEKFCNELKALLAAKADTVPPPPPPPAPEPAPEAKTGSTVFTHHRGEVHHPEANVFDTDEHNNLFLLDNDTNEGQVALYAAGTWYHAISHGTHPKLEDE